MEVSGLNGLRYDEEKALNSLPDAFGSIFSLKDIVSAYCDAGQNADLDGEILYEMQGSSSLVAIDASNGDVKNVVALESSCGSHSPSCSQANGGFTAPKQKWQPVSAARDTSNGKARKDETSSYVKNDVALESSCGSHSLNCSQANGVFTAPIQKWQPVHGASNGKARKDEPSSYVKNDVALESSCGSHSPNCTQANGGFIAPKQNWQPVSAAHDASNGKARKDEPSPYVKNDVALESPCGSQSLNCSQTNGGFTAPKQIWQPVSAAHDASNGKARKGEPSSYVKRDVALESSRGSHSLNCTQANGGFIANKQNWQPVSAAHDTSNGKVRKDEPSSYVKNDVALESSCGSHSLNCSQANGVFTAPIQKWQTVHGTSNGKARKDEPSSYVKNDVALESSCGSHSPNCTQANGGFIAPKQNWQPVSAAHDASNGKARKDEPSPYVKNDVALDSPCGSQSLNCSQTDGGFTAPKQVWQPVSAAHDASNGKARKGEPSSYVKRDVALESSHGSHSLNCTQANGGFIAPKQNWQPVSSAHDTSNGKARKDEPSSYVKNDVALESSRGSHSLSCSQANRGFTAPKQKWQPVSAASDAYNGKAGKDEPYVKNDLALESSFGSHSLNCSQAYGGFTAPKQKWQPVSAAHDPNGKARKDEPPSCCNNLLNSCQTNLKSVKQKWRPVSGGTISSMLGKGHMKSVPVANGSYPGNKPLKVDSKELPMSVLWGEGIKFSSLKAERLHKDMEDFLFKMLGEGFQLDMDVIRVVLESCGYDMQKSMEKLLNRSAVSLEKEHKFLGESSKKINDMHPSVNGTSQEKNRVLNANDGGRQQKDRSDIQNEILTSLFNSPERFDEMPRTRMMSAKRSIALGELVEGPLTDFTDEQKVDRVHSQEYKNDDEDGEDSFQVLRRAVQEYRGTMKEYYKAAVDAFARGDQDQATGLLEQGQFFCEKARQADEESNQKIFETSNMETKDEMLLDLHDHDAKEAIRLLKFHLSSLGGILSFKYLKVILETNEEDSSNGRRRRLVMKLLERESIIWSEGETCGVVSIRLDNINPKSLSFAKR